MILICNNCGKQYDENAEKCPSCGSTNPKGAERAYLDKLENVREDMERLDEAPREELERTIKNQGRLLKRVLLLMAAVVIVVTAGIILINRLDKRDYRAEYLWQQENYPRLDALYDAGNYEELAVLYFELLEDEDSILYEWEHYDFMQAYVSCLFVEGYLEEEKQGELNESTLSFLLSDEWNVKGIKLRREEFTEEEYHAMEPYIEMSEADFASRWNMSETDYAAFYRQLEQNQYFYISYDDCRKYVKRWIKENR